MIKVEYISKNEDFERLRSRWNELLANSFANTIYLTWEWAYSWWQIYGGNKELFVLTAEVGDRLVGIAPLVISKKRLNGFLKIKQVEFLGAEFANGEYLDFIIDKNLETEVLDSMFNFFAQHHKQWDSFHLTDVPRESSTRKHLKNITDRLGYNFSESIRSICPYVILPGKWEVLEAQIKSSLKKNFKYQLRRLAREFDVDIGYCQDIGELERELNVFFDLHRKRWQDKNIEGSFASKEKRQFYIEMANRFLAHGWLRFYSLKLDGQSVAMLFGFQYADKFFFQQSGFDPQFNKYSVGQVMLGSVIADSITNGLYEFDFLRGPEEYKYHWGTVDKRTFRLVISRPNFKSSALNAIETAKKSVKSAISNQYLGVIYA